MTGKIFFTSDTHFDHPNVIRYCDRPWAVKYPRSTDYKRPSELLGFPVRNLSQDELRDSVSVDVDAMNREMVRRWNSVVGPTDTVYHIGDVSMGKKELLVPTISKLNGRKILIRGNHDRSATVMRQAGFELVYEQLETEVDGMVIYMSHKPKVRNRWGTAQVHLCGHVHEKWKRYGDMINVGVDQWDFTPRTLSELLQAESQGHWPKAEEME